MSSNYLFDLDSIDYDLKKSETYVSGYASLPNRDRDGEKILKEGINFNNFLKYGYVNYQHSHEPEDIVGVPVSANVDEKGLKIVVKMLNVPRAKALVDLIKEGHRINKPLVGFSVEGKVLEKDPVESNILKQVEVSWVALTADPINPKTSATLKTFVKGITFFPKNLVNKKADDKQTVEFKNAIETVNKSETSDTTTNTNTTDEVTKSLDIDNSDNSKTYNSIPIPLLEQVINYHSMNPKVPLKKIIFVIRDNLGFINLWNTINSNTNIFNDPDIVNFVISLMQKDVTLSQDPRPELKNVGSLEEQDLTQEPINLNQLKGKKPETNKVKNILELLANQKSITEYKDSLNKSIEEISKSARELLKNL